MRDGTVVHIKDEFFELVDDSTLMTNYENGGYRPHFLCIADASSPSIFWAIPISSRCEKFKKLRAQKIEKYGRCDTIVIADFCGKEGAFLIQNAFPVTVQYIDHIHVSQGQAVIVGPTLTKDLISKLRRCLQRKGLLFTNVNKIMSFLEP